MIDLRGKVIPVVDQKLRDNHERTSISVVNVHDEVNPILVGIAVDGIAEVLNFLAPDIVDTPDFGHLSPPCSGQKADVPQSVSSVLENVPKFGLSAICRERKQPPGSCGAAKERVESTDPSVRCVDWFLCFKKLS